MTRGLQAAAAGMRVQMRRQDVHVNNLANAAAPGLRRSDLMVAQSAFEHVLAEANAMPAAQATSVDITPGPVHETGNAYDVAIDSDGLFTLQTHRGVRFIRGGRVECAPNGQLMSASGDLVMGRSGPIVLPGNRVGIVTRILGWLF